MPAASMPTEVKRFLSALHKHIEEADPKGLVSFVIFPCILAHAVVQPSTNPLPHIALRVVLAAAFIASCW